MIFATITGVMSCRCHQENNVKLPSQIINDRLGKDTARDPKTDYPGAYVRA